METEMNYDKFIEGFCKVEFLCHYYEPNWLGWLVLFGGSFFALVVFVALVAWANEQERRRR